MPSVPDNEEIMADLRRRIKRTSNWRLFFIILMPVGFVIPCSIGLVLGKSAPQAGGFTLAQAFGIAAFALPIIAFGGWLLLAGDRRKYQESLAVAEEANEMGCLFSEQAPKRLMKQLRSFRMFKDADDHFGLNCVSGKKAGKAFSLLEYRTGYSTGPTPYGTKVNMQTVVVFELGLNLPDFRLGPTTWLSKLLKVFGAQTIKLPGQQKFNKKFTVCGDDPIRVQQVVNPQLVQLMLDADGTMEVHGGALLFYRHNHLEEPENYQEMVALTARLAKAVCSQ